MAIRFKELAIALGMLLVSSSALAHGYHFHGAPMSEAEQEASEGVSSDNQMQNRALTDWGDVWRPVYPYLVSGELDPVFKERAEGDKSGTAGQIKAYYRTSYATNVDTIGIENDVMEFYTGNQAASCKYNYAGYKILNYKSDKKGVRYLFEYKTADSEVPKYVQFSDHIIVPRKSSHFHIFTGDTSQAILLKEVENWPTYCPCQLKGEEAMDEMLHH